LNGTFNFFISDKTKGMVDPLTLADAAWILKFFFDTICRSTENFSHSEWSAGSSKWQERSRESRPQRNKKFDIQQNELLVYVVRDRSSSLVLRELRDDIRNRRPDTANLEDVSARIGTAMGATLHLNCGILSEVYYQEGVWDNRPYLARALAYISFHEFMHNKLDADKARASRVVEDIHRQGGDGLAMENFNAAFLRRQRDDEAVLTRRNIQLMARALATARGQCASYVEAFPEETTKR
jgi:hypothetical protein